METLKMKTMVAFEFHRLYPLNQSIIQRMSSFYMRNIARVKTTNDSSDLFLKNNNYLFKYFIFNIKCTSFNTIILF